MSTETKNKLVPRLRFPEFQNYGEWEVKKLGEIGDFFNGGTPDTKNEDYWNGDILWFTPSEIKKKYIKESNRKITELGLKNSSAKLLPKGSILITTRATIGDVGIALEECTTNQGFQSLVVKQNNSNEFWYYYIFNNKSELDKRASGSTFKEITKSKIISIPVLAPSLPEQQKIASCLSSLDELIEAESQKLELYQKHKKGLLQNLFPQEGETVPKLRFPEFKDAGEWEVKKVGDIFEVTRGYVLPMSLVKEKQDNENLYPVYSSQTKKNGLAGFYKEYLYENAITWTTDGANAGDVNYREGKFYCTNVCGVLINKSGFANKCIAELINSVSRKYVSYVGNPKLMNGVMSEIKIPVPSVPEQQKIASCLSSLDDLITAQTQKIEQLQRHKKGLLQNLFPQAISNYELRIKN